MAISQSSSGWPASKPKEFKVRTAGLEGTRAPLDYFARLRAPRTGTKHQALGYGRGRVSISSFIAACETMPSSIE
jgi:hypothetical protein